MGLAKQCLQALSRETIKRLTNVYVTLSLQEMATMLEPIEGDHPYTEQDVERLLVEMVLYLALSLSLSFPHIFNDVCRLKRNKFMQSCRLHKERMGSKSR